MRVQVIVGTLQQNSNARTMGTLVWIREAARAAAVAAATAATAEEEEEAAVA